MTTYSDNVKTMLGSDLAGFWTCAEAGPNFTDETGNGWTMTGNSTPSITYQASGPTINGEAQLAVQFPGAGTSRFLSSGSFPAPSASTGRTYGCWAYFPGDSTAEEFPFARYSASGGYEFFLDCYTTGVLEVDIFDGTNAIAAMRTSIDLDGGVWHLLLGWWNPSDQDVYAQVDNNTPTSQAGSTNIVTSTTNTLSIGATGGGGLPMRNGGRVALAFVVDRVLTDAERLSLYNGQFGQMLTPDADVSTTGWATAPLHSKLVTSDGTVITATAS